MSAGSGGAGCPARQAEPRQHHQQHQRPETLVQNEELVLGGPRDVLYHDQSGRYHDQHQDHGDPVEQAGYGSVAHRTAPRRRARARHTLAECRARTSAAARRASAPMTEAPARRSWQARGVKPFRRSSPPAPRSPARSPPCPSPARCRCSSGSGSIAASRHWSSTGSARTTRMPVSASATPSRWRAAAAPPSSPPSPSSRGCSPAPAPGRRSRGRRLLLALDGLDGRAARGQGLASAFGARFDMEVDALVILALAAIAAGLGKAGPWVLALGLVRYGFVVAGWLAPMARAPAAAVAAPPRGLRAAGRRARPHARPAARSRPGPAGSRRSPSPRSSGPSPSTCAGCCGNAHDREPPHLGRPGALAGHLSRAALDHRPAGALLPRLPEPGRPRLRHRRPRRQPHPRARCAPAPASSRWSRSAPSTPS